MDPDVMITIVFCVEVLLFALVAGVLIARHVGQAKREAVGERGTEPRETEAIRRPRPPATANELTAGDAELVGGRASRALRDVLR
jgi:hypothetical protein